MGIIDGSLTHAYGTGALLSIIAIVMVFLILELIILLTEWIAKVIVKNEDIKKEEVVPTSSGACALNLNDEDATVAALVASIDYRNETKKNVKVVSVREVK